MRKIAANYIFTLAGQPLKNGIIVADTNGTVIEVIDTQGNLHESSGIEFYNGIIVPGFVNAHCHLELSHMKDVLQCRKQGLPAFLSEIIKRRFTPDNLHQIIKQADAEMRAGGIVAVGDISNTDDSFRAKAESELYYHTFAEVFTPGNAGIDTVFRTALEHTDKLKAMNLPGTIVPHAGYSVPPGLYKKINGQPYTPKRVTSVHNQETAGENELFLSQSGPLYDVLSGIGFNYEEYDFQGKNILQTCLPKLDSEQNILLVHNTFTQPDDIDFAENYGKSVYWVLCPNSNLYIEDRLPDAAMFHEKGVKTCLGTDSYSSNDELSILSELKTLCRSFPEIGFENLLTWACKNGAEALMISRRYGTIEKGKRPGLNLISPFDFEKMTLTPQSELRVLI